MDILTDLQQTVATMQKHTGVEVVEFNVKQNYAGFVREALKEKGVEIDEMEVGDEFSLVFTSGHKVRMYVH